MTNDFKRECSFTSWYPLFKKDSLKAKIIPIPNDVLDYLEHGTFVLPAEATEMLLHDTKWADGLPINNEEDTDCQPTFPEFSKEIQDAIDTYGPIFIKSNWSSPLDSIWVAPTKTLQCNTLHDVYLLLKSSNRILKDLNIIKSWSDKENPMESCLVLKQWKDINPCLEFRCFVVEKELIAISQRDISQYYSNNESEKYNIRTDIKSLFTERIKDRFQLDNYCFDVIRYKKDKVKIIDFGPLNVNSVEGTLFTYNELLEKNTNDIPEFRFIGEEVGVQPKDTRHFCIPEEINEFFQASNSSSLLDMIQREVRMQEKED